MIKYVSLLKLGRTELRKKLVRKVSKTKVSTCLWTFEGSDFDKNSFKLYVDASLCSTAIEDLRLLGIKKYKDYYYKGIIDVHPFVATVLRFKLLQRFMGVEVIKKEVYNEVS